MGNRRWEGGYISESGVYVIEKKVAGVRFHVSTRCTSKEAARAHLRRFQTNPGAYSPAGDALPNEVVLTLEMIEKHFQWTQATINKETAQSYRRFLGDWLNHFRGRDLRRLELVADLKPHLVAKKSVAHRIKALKSLYRWLIEEEGKVKPTDAENPTVRLKVSKGKPSQFHGQVYVEWERVARVLPHIEQPHRDVFEFMSGTGWHLTEIQRFAREGTIRDRRPGDPPNVVGVVAVPQHKSGVIHVVNLIKKEHLHAAQRIRDRGHVADRWWTGVHLDRAFTKCNKGLPEKEQVKRFTARQLRHSVETWLVESGMSRGEAAEYIGHDPRTARKHYVDAFVGAVVPQPGHLRVLDSDGSTTGLNRPAGAPLDS